MASSLAKTKRRIASIQGTEKITKAMGLTATVKTKKFLALHEQSIAYTQEFLALMSAVFSHDHSSDVSHYAKMNEGDLPILYLVISSNMGLCGAYNNNLFRYLDHEIGPNDIVAPLGNKAIHRFSRDPRYASRTDSRYEYVGLNTWSIRYPVPHHNSLQAQYQIRSAPRLQGDRSYPSGSCKCPCRKRKGEQAFQKNS